MTPGGPISRVILVAPEGAEWVSSTFTFLAGRRHVVARLASLSFASFLALRGGVAALIIDARMLGAGSAAKITQLRTARPRLRVVAIGAAGPDAKHALEAGGTSYLSWPFAVDDLKGVLPD